MLLKVISALLSVLELFFAICNGLLWAFKRRRRLMLAVSPRVATSLIVGLVCVLCATRIRAGNTSQLFSW